MYLRMAIAIMLSAGVAHADAISPSAVEFEDGAVARSLTGGTGSAETGGVIVGDKKQGNCVSCHKVSALTDVPFQGEVGPPLDGAADRWTEAELRGIVSNAKMMFEGTIMPSFYKNSGYIRPGDAYTGKAAVGELPPILSAEQVEDIVAFLLTLK